MEALVLQVLGEDFLAYVCTSSPEQIRDHLAGGEQLTGDQEAVFREVGEFAAAVVAKNSEPWHVQSELCSTFGSYYPQAGTSIANMLRKRSGGSIWESNADDELLRILQTVLRDVYPLLLIADNNGPFAGWPASRLSTSLFQHPLRANLWDKFLAHEQFGSLFPNRGDHDAEGIVFTSVGRGGTTAVSGLSSALLGAGWSWARLSNLCPSVEEHVAGLTWAVESSVSAIQRKSVDVPVRIGLTGVLMPEGASEIDLGWARIRPARESDFGPIYDRILKGETETTTEEGDRIKVSHRGDLVVEMEIPYKVRIRDSMDVGSEWPQDLDPGPLIGERMQSIRLGLLLAYGNVKPRVLVQQSWMRILDPLDSNTTLSWSRPDSFNGLVPRQLKADDIPEWRRWSMLIAEHRTPSVKIATSRAITAVAERSSPEDVLVDAVVVWENLFGSQQETTMRVTSSLAWLLGENVSDRKLKAAQFKKLYTLRSGIVHGSRELKPGEARIKADEAVDVALDALRKVFGERQDLLREKSSEDRSNRLLLGD